jgi:hypothetical protein
MAATRRWRANNRDFPFQILQIEQDMLAWKMLNSKALLHCLPSSVF